MNHEAGLHRPRPGNHRRPDRQRLLQLQLTEEAVTRPSTSYTASDPDLSIRAFRDEVVEAIGGKMPVLIDSGFRRGTDIFKALALGAQGICIGRPYLWGLAAFGQPGVERALELLTKELELTMRMNGAPSISSITRRFVTG